MSGSRRWLVRKSHGWWMAIEPCSAGCQHAHRPWHLLARPNDVASFGTWREAFDYADRMSR